MVPVCRCGRARLFRGRYFRESAPCLALQAAAPADASLSLLLRGLCTLTRVSSLVLLVSQHFLFCLCHARVHSGVEHTSAVSTGTVRDPYDQTVESSIDVVAKPLHTVLLFVVFTRGPPAPLCTRSGSRSVQSSFGNTSSPGKKALFAAYTTSASDTSMFVTTLSRFTVPSDPSPYNSAIAKT